MSDTSNNADKSSEIKQQDSLGAGENRMNAVGKFLSRFRKRYRKLSDAEIAYHDAIKDHAAQFEFLIASLGTSRELSIALQHLENVVMWHVKDLTGDRRSRDSKGVNDEKLLETLKQLPSITAD